MKEMGERFEELRESIGISIEEAAADLKVLETDLLNIEKGNSKAFENVVFLKKLIRNYSKYLGLDEEEMLDEYNEYLFDQTSKISLEDIKEAKRKLEQKEKKQERFPSPYTSFKKEIKKSRYFIIIGLILFFVTLMVWISIFMEKDENTKEDVTDVEIGGQK